MGKGQRKRQRKGRQDRSYGAGMTDGSWNSPLIVKQKRQRARRGISSVLRKHRPGENGSGADFRDGISFVYRVQDMDKALFAVWVAGLRRDVWQGISRLPGI
jgi:hypothetical protein